jgi:GT2 family glycosyltransferase
MLSVIMPTMWKFHYTARFLEQIVNYDAIGEIIVIDNESSSRPESAVFTNPKIRLIDFGKNIFVNPAWNHGASTARYDNLCFLSDDVIVDLRSFYEADRYLTANKDNSIGLLCGLCEHELHNQPKISTGEIEIYSTNEKPGIGFHGGFSYFFCRKESYIPIPDKLKIVCGDAYLWNKMRELDKTHHMMYNYFYYSPWNVTVNFITKIDELAQILREDLENWDRMIENKEVMYS